MLRTTTKFSTCLPSVCHVLQRRRVCHIRHARAKEPVPSLLQQEPVPASQFTKDQLVEQAVVMFAAGATLGPFCDGLHSSSNVLHYTHPTITSLGPLALETCWWVPLLFGCAGLVLGMSYPVLDTLLESQQQQQQQQQPGTSGTASSGSVGALVPSWMTTLLCISLFVGQYKLSAVLDTQLSGNPGLADIILLTYGLAVWRCLDNTGQGLAMSCLTALLGPALEVVLINSLQLYHYQHAQVLGVPTWIPWVYFCGGPAVGLLGRRVWATLMDKQKRIISPSK